MPIDKDSVKSAMEATVFQSLPPEVILCVFETAAMHGIHTVQSLSAVNQLFHSVYFCLQDIRALPPAEDQSRLIPS